MVRRLLHSARNYVGPWGVCEWCPIVFDRASSIQTKSTIQLDCCCSINAIHSRFGSTWYLLAALKHLI